MERISEVVDIELTKEETILLKKSRILCAELLIELKRIQTKRQPDGVTYVQDAIVDISRVIGDFQFHNEDDKDIENLDEKYEELCNILQDPRNFS